MADKPQRPFEIEGDSEPKSVAKAGFELAKGMIEERKDRKEAIKEIAKGFPLLYHFIRYSEGLGWRGMISKRWKQFAEVYADYMQVANLAYDKFGEEYDELFPGLDKGERIWFMMCDKLSNINEDVNALLIEMMPEMKREIELKTESLERTAFFEVLKEQKPKKASLSIEEQRRIIDEYGSK